MHLPDWAIAIILGIIEGLTEFLPVSSTGHMMVAGQWLGFNSVNAEVFEMVIQIGALAAVWWLYRRRIVAMMPWKWAANPGMRRLALNVILAFLPVAVLGLLTHGWVKAHLFGPTSIAWAFITGGVAILVVEYFKPRVTVDGVEGIAPALALAIGFGQCLALWPGMSRSGATIVVALILGVSRGAATEFTFLLAVPTMTALAAKELVKYRHDLDSSMALLLAIGLVVSFVVAWLVVKWFIRFVQSHTLNIFGWYRIVAGAAILWLASRGILHHP